MAGLIRFGVSMKIALNLLIGSLAFFVSTTSATTICTGLLCIAPETWEKTLLTLVGTFVGASLAFLSQIALQKKQEKKTELLAAHRILFCLLQQSNFVTIFHKQFVVPHAESVIKFIEIPATSERDMLKNLYDFDSFNFLLKSTEGRKIMYDLYLAQENYVELLQLINERSQWHRERLQPRMEEMGMTNGEEVLLSELKEKLGSLVVETMVNATNQILTLLPETFDKLVKVKATFRAHAVKYFATSNFTEFDFPESLGLQSKKSSPFQSQ